MKLSEKGKHAPRPRLPSHAERVAEALSGWPAVVARAHWLLGDETRVDGADFYVGDEEIGHLHLDGEAHVAVGRKLGAALIEAGLAERFPWSNDFIQHDVAKAAHVAPTLFLFELAYARRRGTSLTELETRVRAFASASPSSLG